MKSHQYTSKIHWSTKNGKGTESYKSYSRNHTISVEGKYGEILASSDPSFRGDVSKYNPEELFLSSISSCHMLWYLHLCSENDIVVLNYSDEAMGSMQENEDGSGQFKKVILNPIVTIIDENKIDKAESLHKIANKMCFIANSCNFSIEHIPTIVIDN